MSPDELQIVSRVLSFNDRLIGEVMTPRRRMKTVAAADTIGPVLMDELHASGHTRFPVTGKKPTDIVGTLYLNDLIHNQYSGTVQDVMDKKSLLRQ